MLQVKIDTIKEYVKHNFHPIKHFSRNPMELFYWFLTVVASILILIIIGVVFYCCIAKILIPCMKINSMNRMFRFPAAFPVAKNSQEINSQNPELQPMNILPAIENSARHTNTHNIRAVDSNIVSSSSTVAPPPYPGVRNMQVSLSENRPLTSVSQIQPVPAQRRIRQNQPFNLMSYSLLADRVDSL